MNARIRKRGGWRGGQRPGPGGLCGRRSDLAFYTGSGRHSRFRATGAAARTHPREGRSLRGQTVCTFSVHVSKVEMENSGKCEGKREGDPIGVQLRAHNRRLLSEASEGAGPPATRGTARLPFFYSLVLHGRPRN